MYRNITTIILPPFLFSSNCHSIYCSIILLYTSSTFVVIIAIRFRVHITLAAIISALACVFLFPQCCDLGFHASLARTFRTYLSAEYNLETSRHEGLDIIENAVDNLDARSDKHKVMDLCNQVFCPPVKFDFQPHMDDEVCQVSAQQPVQMELLVRYHQLQSRLMTLKIENEE
ncbi:hypothetical protein GDO81_019020, partial [Engystomops pustulosus]